MLGVRMSSPGRHSDKHCGAVSLLQVGASDPLVKVGTIAFSSLLSDCLRFRIRRGRAYILAAAAATQEVNDGGLEAA